MELFDLNHDLDQWKNTPERDTLPEDDMPGLDAWLKGASIPELEAELGSGPVSESAEDGAIPADDADAKSDTDAESDTEHSAAPDQNAGKNPPPDWKKQWRIWNRRVASFLLASCMIAAPLLGTLSAGRRVASGWARTVSPADAVRAAVRLETGANKTNLAKLKNTGKIRVEGGRLLYGEREYYIEDGRVYLSGEAFGLSGMDADVGIGAGVGNGMDAGGENIDGDPPLRIAILDDTVYIISGEEEEWIAIDDSLAKNAAAL